MIQIKLREQVGKWETAHGETLSYRRLESATGISRDTLSRYGRGIVSYVRLSDLAALCAFFSCAVPDLLEYKPD